MLEESLTLNKLTNSTPIHAEKPGTSVYMDLRAIGAGLYEYFNLPDSISKRYVVSLNYISW